MNWFVFSGPPCRVGLVKSDQFLLKGRYMIGLSFSYCVKDIASGVVDIDNVERVEAGTLIRSDEKFQSWMDQIEPVYWQGLPKARSIAEKLWKDGRVYQPRLHGEEPANIASGRWRN